MVNPVQLRMIRKMTKKIRLKLTFSLLFIILLSFIFRVVFLDRIPTGVSNDEIDYLLNAKSIYLSGSGIGHTWNPLSLTTPKSSVPQAEIIPILTFLFIGPFPLSLAASKLVYAIFSVGIVFLIYLITRKLIGETEAFCSGLVAACNPWLIFFGRSAYDVTFAIFFFLLGFYILLVSKKWYILLSFPAFFIGFYSYIGTKLILLPFVLVTTTYAWFSNKKYIKHYIILLLLCICLLSFYVISTLRATGSRIGELASPNMMSNTDFVDYERRLSIHTPLTEVFSNKYIVFGKYAIEKYYNAFSPNFLFLNGDGKAQFTLWTHGVFYYLDVIFLFIGLIMLFIQNKRSFTVLLAIMLLAPIPSVMSTVGNSYAVRSMLLAPIFIIFIGVGITFVTQKIRYSWIIVIVAYSILILNFVNIYFFRNPIYNSEAFNFSSREMAKYLSFHSGIVYVIDQSPRTPFKQYLFYSNGLRRSSTQQIADDFKNNSFSTKQIHYITCEQFNQIKPGATVIYSVCKKVPVSIHDVYISQLSDGGTTYTISNDTICSQYNLHKYPYGITFSDLNLDKLTQKEFCTKYITKH